MGTATLEGSRNRGLDDSTTPSAAIPLCYANVCVIICIECLMNECVSIRIISY